MGTRPCPRSKAQVKFHLALDTHVLAEVVYGGRRLPKLGREDGFTDRAKVNSRPLGR